MDPDLGAIERSAPMPPSPETEPRHPIGVVSGRTGLPQDVLRAWERRYRVVVPHRGEAGRRLYTDGDLEKLRLLRLAVESGRRISDVASLSLEALRELAREDANAAETVRRRGTAGTPASAPAPEAAFFLDAAMGAVERLDGGELASVLRRAHRDLSLPKLRVGVILPLLTELGRGWREGTLRIAHEHMATAIVRTFLGTVRGNLAVPPGAPSVVVSTPAGQRHELGALMAAIAAQEIGWEAVYLGPDLPAAEIASVVLRRNARAVALSLVAQAADQRVSEELAELRRLLGGGFPIFVGGAAASGWAEALVSLGVTHVEEAGAFQRALEALAP
jgi:DNA-binding transcriptional MerR regulator/methanogenic corrinoid protein MtbC1